MSSTVKVTQATSGTITATVYIDQASLITLGPNDNTLIASFEYSAGVLCKTTTSISQTVACPAPVLAGKTCISASCTGPAPSVLVSDVVVAQTSICPSTELFCGMNAGIAVSDLVKLSGTGNVGGGGGVAPGGAIAPVLPSGFVRSTTAAALPGGGGANTPDVPNTDGNGNVGSSSGSTTAGVPLPGGGGANTPGIAAKTTAGSVIPSQSQGSSDGNSSGPSAALIGIGIAVALAIIGAIGFIVMRRRSIEKKKAARESLAADYYNGSVPHNFEENAKPVSKNSAFNSAAPVALKALEKKEASKPETVQRSPQYVAPPRQGQTAVATSAIGQKVQYVAPQYAAAQNTSYPPTSAAPQQPVTYPGFYDNQGQYHYYTQAQLQQMQQQQNQQGLTTQPQHPRGHV
ncbi:hypothetical protein HDU79_006539 [Rhizoclosmatium sp. JEL0117]|nr:hypothetical protein HDU79_006539 [Rhizoclosmatium sp. JEL0117]